jgi:hypothetical protein
MGRLQVVVNTIRASIVPPRRRSRGTGGAGRRAAILAPGRLVLSPGAVIHWAAEAMLTAGFRSRRCRWNRIRCVGLICMRVQHRATAKRRSPRRSATLQVRPECLGGYATAMVIRERLGTGGHSSHDVAHVNVDAGQGVLERCVAEGEESSVITDEPIARPTGDRHDRGDVVDVDVEAG